MVIFLKAEVRKRLRVPGPVVDAVPEATYPFYLKRLAPRQTRVQRSGEPMALGIFAAIVWIASPALAQHASQSDSVHHRQRVRLSSPPGTSAFTSPPRDTRTWVGDPAGRPYIYIPGMASGGGGN